MKRIFETHRGEKRRTNVIAALVFLILSVCLYVQAQKQTDKIRFKHLSVADGLSQEAVNCIIQDKKGFMWFGTQDGLNRYDGYNFKVYKNDLNDISAISDKYILCIYEDWEEVLWIGTRDGGLNRFDRESDNFITFKDNPTTAAILGDYDVKTIREGPNGNLWIGTQGGGLLRLLGLNKDKKINKFKGYKDKDRNGPSDNYINIIFKDVKGRIWIGTRKGLDSFDQEGEKFYHYQIKESPPENSSEIDVTAICEDQNGLLWIGTYDGRLYRSEIEHGITQFSPYQIEPDKDSISSDNPIRCLFKDQEGFLWVGTQKKLIRFRPGNGEPTEYQNDPYDNYSMNNNEVLSIYQDKTGIIWLGTYGGGLNIYDPAIQRFKLYTRESNNLSHNTIWAIHVDSKERLWVGTYEGLNLIDQKTGKFIPIKDLEKEDIRCIYKDKVSETLWIGTFKNGLFKFNPKTTQVEKHYPPYKKGLSDKGVMCIFQIRPNEMWLGTFEGGLNKFNPKTEEFIPYRFSIENPNSLSNDRVRVILEDMDGKLWIGTDGGGVNLLTYPEKGIFKRYSCDKNDPHSLSHDRIKTIYQDKSGRIWIGTDGGGLNLFDKKNGHFKAYGLLKRVVPNDTVYGILEDDQGNLWMSTNSGLFKFSLKTGNDGKEKITIKNYDLQDGLQCNEFDTGAYFKNEKTGEMFFGGARGFNSFYPRDIKEDMNKPSVTLTDFLLFNISQKPQPIQLKEKTSPLGKSH